MLRTGSSSCLQSLSSTRSGREVGRGVNPCGKASGKHSPHPGPPLQAGEGAVRDELIDLALAVLFCELPPVWIYARASLLNALSVRLKIFPGQQCAKAGMTALWRFHHGGCSGNRMTVGARHRRTPTPLRGIGYRNVGFAFRSSQTTASWGTFVLSCRRLPATPRYDQDPAHNYSDCPSGWYWIRLSVERAAAPAAGRRRCFRPDSTKPARRC